MNREVVLRRALWLAAGFNLLAALLFAFPASTAGELVGLPREVPLAYRAMTALFVLLFGGAYAWLAVQRVVDRALVVFGAIGKTSAFIVIVVLWRMGAAGGLGALLATGDVVLAAVFLWCVGGVRGMASIRNKVTREAG
jgi:hypothetical protein